MCEIGVVKQGPLNLRRFHSKNRTNAKKKLAKRFALQNVYLQPPHTIEDSKYREIDNIISKGKQFHRIL